MYFNEQNGNSLGASRGLGRNCLLFAKEGYNIVINYYKSEKSALKLEHEISQFTNVIAIKADISDSNQVKAW